MMVSGMDLFSWSHKALSSSCSLGLIRKLIDLVRVSGSPRLLGRPALPVSGALVDTGLTRAITSSTGFGVNVERASASEEGSLCSVGAIFRANGSGGDGLLDMV
jgi:hypothetical protein